MFIRLDRICERDGRTDRQMCDVRDGIGCACIESRGKNYSYSAEKHVLPKFHLLTQCPLLSSRSASCCGSINCAIKANCNAQLPQQ